jgi:prepilin-type N-terminal cleavage/methylation domain-containing protein
LIPKLIPVPTLIISRFDIIKVPAMQKDKNGFTLLELLVVISIIGILSALLLANFNAARERARDSQRKSDMRNIQTALQSYYSDYGGYPTSGVTGGDLGKIVGCAPPATPTICAWGASWSPESGKVLMSTLPEDPQSPTQNYMYTQTDLDTYTLKACLENKSDDKAVFEDVSWCPSKYTYTVKP